MTFPLRSKELSTDLGCSYSFGDSTLRAAGTSAPNLSSGGAAPPGFGLYNLEMTYDSSDGYLLLFGATGHGARNGTETWGFRAGNWTRLYPVNSPESCVGSALTYDQFDGYVVYLAGGNLLSGQNCSSAGQTWEFRAGNWTRLHPAISPSPRQAAAFTNDSADGYLLLFGGACRVGGSLGACGDTWSFIHGAWTKRNVTGSPSARAGAGMTYDASDGYVLLFGGITWPPSWSTPLTLGDTWKYKGGTWTQIGSCGGPSRGPCGYNVPPEPYIDGMTYDASDGVVLYTCARNNGTNSGDPENYYTFHAGRWTSYNRNPWGFAHRSLPTPVPPNRLGEGLAYDWGDGYAVMFGGVSIYWTSLRDTWLFHADHWRDLTRGFDAGPSAVRFYEERLPTGTKWNVTIGTTTISSTGREILFSLGNGSYTATAASAASTASPTVRFTVVGFGANVVVAFDPKGGPGDHRRKRPPRS